MSRWVGWRTHCLARTRGDHSGTIATGILLVGRVGGSARQGAPFNHRVVATRGGEVLMVSYMRHFGSLRWATRSFMHLVDMCRWPTPTGTGRLHCGTLGRPYM